MLHIPPVAWWISAPFFCWRVAVRVRRLLARQRYRAWRQWGAAASLGALACAAAVVAAEEHAALLALLGGICFGAFLGVVGMRLARFESEDGELYFQPNPYLGSALTLLLLLRIAWRLYAGPHEPSGWTVEEVIRNGSTMLLFGLFSAHYLVFALGIIRRASRTWSVPAASTVRHR